MEKFSKPFIIVAVSLFVGVFVGIEVTERRKDDEIKKLNRLFAMEMKREIEQARRVVSVQNSRIQYLNTLIKQDSIKINNLQFKIKQDGVKMEQKRREAASMDNKEKSDWLVQRYSNNSQ